MYPTQTLSFIPNQIIDAGAYLDNQVRAGTHPSDDADLIHEFFLRSGKQQTSSLKLPPWSD
jgi:hypothetical protein